MVQGRGAVVVLTTTVASEAEADALADAALKARLAACVQVTAIRSAYRWQGGVERSEELRCDFKTTEDKMAALAELLSARHAYDEPELIATRTVWSSEGYAAWVAAETA